MAKLSEPLTREQIELLKIIWKPVNPPLAVAGWPVWDYVSRKMHNFFPQLSDAKDVLRSLPTVPIATLVNRDYGLVWTSHHSSVPPSTEERIGLTVAGLAALAEAGGVNHNVPDAVAAIIGRLAAEEDELEPNPHAVVTSDVPLARFTQSSGWFGQPAQDRVMPDRALADVLLHEYAPVGIIPAAGTGSTIRFSSGGLVCAAI